jgi:hypothetical protein
MIIFRKQCEYTVKVLAWTCIDNLLLVAFLIHYI